MRLLLALMLLVFPAFARADTAAPIIYSRSEIVVRVFPAEPPPEQKPQAPAAKSPKLAGPRDLRFQVEIQTPAQLAQEGIFMDMALAPGTGVLIPYERPTQVQVPLAWATGSFDLLFVDAHGDIREVYPWLTGGVNEAPVVAKDAVTAVLRLPGGVADKYGVKPGDRVISPLFTPKLRTIEAPRKE